MKRQESFGAIALIFGVALAAMTAGHALMLALGPSPGYSHIAQAPTVVLALVLGIASLVTLARGLVRSLHESRDTSDWALPAVFMIRSSGPARIIPSVVVAYTAALFFGEALEQHISGVSIGGVAGLYGSTLSIAPFVHLAIALAAGAILWLAARAVCENVRQAVILVRAAIAWLSRDERPSAPNIDRLVFVRCGPRSKPIAHNLANRPPPASVRFA